MVQDKVWDSVFNNPIFILVQFDDKLIGELKPDAIYPYSLSFSDGTTMLPIIHNIFNFKNDLIAVMKLKSDPAEPISLLWCPVIDPIDVQNKVIKCTADVPASKAAKKLGDDPTTVQTFSTTFGDIELIENTDTPTLLVVDSTIDDQNAYTMNGVSIYTLGDDFTDPSWATQAAQFTNLPDTSDPLTFSKDTRSLTVDIEKTLYSYAILNLRGTDEFLAGLVLSLTFPAQISPLKYRSVTNPYGALFAVDSTKANYQLYRDWNPDFLLLNTSKIDPTKVSSMTITATDMDGQKLNITTQLNNIKGKLTDSLPLVLKKDQAVKTLYLQDFDNGVQSIYGYSNIQSGVDVHIIASNYIPPSSSSSVSSATTSSQELHNKNANDDDFFEYIYARGRII